MHIQKYLDVDRNAHGYILTVKTHLNKKGETIETILQVEHLGLITAYALFTTYRELSLWDRAIQSGDVKSLYRRVAK